MKILTVAEEAARLKERFIGVNRAEFARVNALKGGQSMIYQNITGRRPISMEAAMAYARGFGCTLDDISPRLAKEATAAAVHLDQPQSPASLPAGTMRVVVAEAGDPAFYDVPKVKVVVRAGVTGFQTIPEIFDGSTLSVPRHWMDRKKLTPESLIAMTVTGESMEPRLFEGDLVVVDTADKKMQDGEVFVFNYGGEVVIKRLIKERGSWWLFSDNPDQAKYRPRGCKDEECSIIGKVIRRETDHI